MMTATNRNVGDERSPMRVLANSAYAGGVDWDLRLLRKRYALAGYFAGSTHQRHRSGHRPAAGEQRPQLSASRRDARRIRSDEDLAQRPVGISRVPQDLRRARPLRVEHRLQVTRLRQQRPRIHQARRPDLAEQLDAVAPRQARQIHPQLPLQPQSVERPQLRRRPAPTRRQRQRALELQEQLVHRASA